MEGTPFGKYRLITLLGRGGMGEVWRAYDTAIDRTVAIKILSAATSQDPVFQQRFRREAHAAARLNSPHVIPIHTHGEIDGRLFVDMRLIDGRDLQNVLADGPLEPARAVWIIEQVAKALSAAHRVGLMHRDVKPSNILLDEDDYAYLIDFGIARTLGEMGLTTAGDVIGTFHYMAPERFNADQVDSRSDIYSLTCVLHECLTGRRPFPGDSAEQQLAAHLTTPPPRPTLSNPRLPGAFDTVIATGMAKNPDQRYATAVKLARAAREAITAPITRREPPAPSGPSGGRPPAPPPRESPPRPAPVPPPVRRQPPGAAAPYRQQAVPRQPPPAVAPPPRPAVASASPPAVTPASPPAVTPALQPWWRRKPVIAAGVLLAVVVVVAVVAVATLGHPHPRTADSRQTALPFVGLSDPEGLSVDNGGTVYVADTPHNRVMALSAGSTTATVLPFDGLDRPTGVTADNSGTVYVTDAGNKRVVILPPGSTRQSELPFADLGNPTGVTVDSSRTVYITDTSKNRVVALPAGSNQQTELPFTGLSNPTGVVVSQTGTVYVADGGNNQVLALPADSKTQVVVQFTGLQDPGGVTLDNAGSVYVTDRGNNRVLKLPAGSTTQIELPFTGLQYPWGLSVANSGTVYVASRNDQIVALRP